MAWMPNRWFVILTKKGDDWSYEAGIHHVFKVASTSNFRSEIEASTHAAMLIKSLAYDLLDTGWSKFRCHGRLPFERQAICGVVVGDEPNLAAKETPGCGNCYRMAVVMERCQEWIRQNPAGYRYVYKTPFNSQREDVG